MAEKQMQSLARDTAIYGVSSILGKFLNWLLVPMYTYVLTGSADYGQVANLYAWSALLLVIMTYGMETGFFRFANKNKEQASKVYGNTLLSVGVTSLIFAVTTIAFASPIASVLGYGEHPEYIAMLGAVIAMDALGSIPFAWLRFSNRPIKFASLKLLMIITNILFNIFFLVVCPWIYTRSPELISWFYKPDYGVGYVLVANVIQTVVVTLALLPEIRKANFSFESALLKKILAYSLPLMILGIAGIMNQTLDKIIFPFLMADKELAISELGIYSACFKISMVMMMFTQAFRYAYEPFIFAQHKDKNSNGAYADAMKYFVIFSWLIFLALVFYLDLIQYLIRSDYRVGLRVIPIVLISYIFQGVFFNLSLWYKLTDRTHYGAWISIIGTIITLVVNVIFVPLISYMASAWASFACYLVMMIISYFLGQKYMPINYDLKKIGFYSILAMGLYAVSLMINTPFLVATVALKTVLLVIFITIVIKRDFPLKSIPYLSRFFNRN